MAALTDAGRPMKTIARVAVALGLAGVLSGCFEAPPDQRPECFQGGGVVLDLQTKVTLEIDEDRDSDICCEDNRDCQTRFEEAGLGIKIGALAVCEPIRDGRGNGNVCALDCDLDVNCECVRNSDCDPVDPADPITAQCVTGSGAQCDFASEDATTSNNDFQVAAGTGRCAYCARCAVNGDCADKAGRPICDNGVCAECAANTDCAGAPGRPICGAGACVECVEDSDCGEGRSCNVDTSACEG